MCRPLATQTVVTVHANQPAPATPSCGAASGQWELDPVLGLVEPPMAATLELQRLRAFDKVGARF